MAERLDLDPSLVRIVWAILIVLSGGLFLLLYVVMAIVVPEAPTRRGPLGGLVTGERIARTGRSPGLGRSRRPARPFAADRTAERLVPDHPGATPGRGRRRRRGAGRAAARRRVPAADAAVRCAAAGARRRRPGAAAGTSAATAAAAVAPSIGGIVLILLGSYFLLRTVCAADRDRARSGR